MDGVFLVRFFVGGTVEQAQPRIGVIAFDHLAVGGSRLANVNHFDGWAFSQFVEPFEQFGFVGCVAGVFEVEQDVVNKHLFGSGYGWQGCGQASRQRGFNETPARRIGHGIR